MCQKIPLKDYLLKPSFLSGKVHGQWGASKNRWIWSGLEWILDCLLLDLDINYISKTRKQYARWWPLWSDLCIREEYEKQQDISFLKEIWKLNTGLKFCCEVQILSLNRPRSSWGGKRDFKSQSRKGNKTLTKEEKRKSRIFFLTSTSLHSVASPSAVFLSGFYDGIVLKGPHQRAEIPKDTQLQGLTNE